MITTHLKLDLYEFSPEPNNFDSVNLEFNEDIYNVLQGFDDVDYSELYLVTEVGSVSEESLVACFRRIKLKGNKDYQWIVCKEEKF